MRKLIIVGKDIFNFKKNKLNIGGIQTYVYDLAVLGIKNKMEIYVIQQGIENKNLKINNILFKSIKIKKQILKSDNQILFNYIKNNYFQEKRDVIIISTDQLDIKSNLNNVISIQHGIAFDIPGDLLKGIWGKTFILQIINKSIRCLKNVKRFYNTKKTVCVDYNYYNWFRTIGTIKDHNSLTIIPNYVACTKNKYEIEEKLNNRKNKKILFARRFVDYRGVILFSNVVSKLIIKYPDIEITFAGEGNLKNYIIERFSKIQNVTITSFPAKNSVEFHYQYDIAVVPTIYSEGTSLALNEAMAAGCYPIVTHVGGMTNVIIDGFNGSLSYPSEEFLYKSIEETLELDHDSFNEIVINAFKTAELGFTKEKWDNKWTSVLENSHTEINQK